MRTIMAPQIRSGTNLCIVLLMLANISLIHSKDYESSLDIFNGRFYQEAALLNSDKDLVVSSLSADMVFAMLAAGAEGETKREILNSLLLQDLDSETSSIKDIIEKLNTIKGVTLNLANKIYVKPGFSGNLDSVRTTYRSIIQDVFKSDIQQVDFSRSVETAKEINSWVENHTNNRIQNLISEDAIDGMTAAILVNAIYFKGNWANKFHRTSSHDFFLADGSTTNVKMMHNVGNFLYKDSSELDAQIILLPYENEDLSMLVILPKQINGLDALEKKLINGTNQYLDKLHLYDVSLSLPKFKIESTIDVKSIMKKLGANKVFSPAAELKGILKEDTDLYVSEAIQKAFIEVNEEGTEAAAATGTILQSRSGKYIPYVEFNADHPFYFVILKSRTIALFSGSKKQ